MSLIEEEVNKIAQRYNSDLIAELSDEITTLQAENAALKRDSEADDIRWMQITYFVESLRMNTAEKGMVAGWLDELDEILNSKTDALLKEPE